MPVLPPAPPIDAEATGRAVREAEAALCRIHAYACAMMPNHLAYLVGMALHALGLARAASVELVADSGPFYLAPPWPSAGPECTTAPDLPPKPCKPTDEQWERLAAEVATADALLLGIVKAFGRHAHVANRWSDVILELDAFWGVALAARAKARAARRRGRRSNPKSPAKRGGSGPLVDVEVL